MTAPKPITITVITPEDYDGPTPQPFAVVDDGSGILASILARLDAIETALED